MALNIKNKEVERLAGEVAALGGTTKTEAIRQALIERQNALAVDRHRAPKAERVLRFLEDELWPNAAVGELGRPWTRDEEDDVLGFGPDGV